MKDWGTAHDEGHNFVTVIEHVTRLNGDSTVTGAARYSEEDRGIINGTSRLQLLPTPATSLPAKVKRGQLRKFRVTRAHHLKFIGGDAVAAEGEEDAVDLAG